jgi:hypothetical protein
MRVFISWSGDRSEQIAKLLHGWMQRVIQAIDPYASATDMEKGVRWAADLASHLEGINFGIVCLLPENLNAPWIQFEAGALAKSLAKGKVSPILFDVTPAELSGNPLVQFQATRFEKDDVLKLMHSINRAEDAEAVKPEILDRAFEQNWPDLEGPVRSIMASAKRDVVQPRQEKMFEEIVALSREHMKSLLVMEEKIGRLLPGNVQLDDVVVLTHHFQALTEFAERLHAVADEVAERVGREKADPGVLNRLKRMRTASDRLHSGARKATQGGCTVSAMRTALPDLRAAHFVLSHPL